jgi:hypothetical protein
VPLVSAVLGLMTYQTGERTAFCRPLVFSDLLRGASLGKIKEFSNVL